MVAARATVRPCVLVAKCPNVPFAKAVYVLRNAFFQRPPFSSHTLLTADVQIGI